HPVLAVLSDALSLRWNHRITESLRLERTHKIIYRENTKLLVACAPALKCDHKGYTGKLERTDDHTAGKMVVGYLVQSRGLEEQWNNLLSSCQLSWLVLKVPAGVRDCERVCECTREGKSWGFLSRTSKCVP
uniref:Uncharacterized protein n=1 Tax=Pavo cristatus TaxID=9049 RepID=A0A8C9FA93_PAVCR